MKNAFATYGQADLAQLSRNAIKYIYACLQAGDKGVRGQKIYEAIDSTATGDDAILDCAMYWHEKQAREVILLSNDKNLCSKMIIHGLRAISHELGQSSASILRQVLSVTEREGISSIEAINLAAHQPAMDTDEPQLPPPSAAIEMEIDPIIAPVVNPRKIDDPFEALAAKAGESRYKRTSRPLLVRGTSPESTYRRPARADSSPNQFIQRARSYSPDEMMAWSEGTRSRSSSPDSVRYSMTSSIRSSPGSPTSAKYRNLSVIEATILQRFPVLIKHHLQIEFKDESVVDLLVNDNAIKDVDNVLNLICQHWQVCFRKICQKSLSAYTSSRVLEGTSLRTYLKTLSAIFSTPSSEEKVVASLRVIANIWSDLSSHESRSYKNSRDSELRSWQMEAFTHSSIYIQCIY